MKIKNIIIISSIFILMFAIFLFVFSYVYPLNYKNEIIKYANEYDLSPSLVASLINAESGFDKNAISNYGAVGLMQIIPSTATEISTKLNDNDFEYEMLYDINTNIEYGCFYLRYLLNIFEDTNTALCAYNAGLSTVYNWLDDSAYSSDGKTLQYIPYPETKKYVEKIMRGMSIYKYRFN